LLASAAARIAGRSVAEGDGVGVGVGVDEVFAEATSLPLLQVNFLPDSMQV